MPIAGDSLKLGPWPKGVFYNLPSEEVPEDGLASMTNIRLGMAGQCDKRPGCASYASLATLGESTSLTGVFQFDKSTGTSYVVVVAGTEIYYKGISSWTEITGSTTITAADDTTFEFANANDTLVLCNGVDDAALKWTGTGNAAALDVDSRFTKPKHVAWWDNRLWMGSVSGSKDRIWYSAVGDPETWAATNYKAVGAPVTGLMPFHDLLAVHTETGIWTITPTGNSEIPYEVHQVSSRGALAGRAIVTLPGRRQLFVLRDGIYRWDADDDRLEKVSYALDDGYWDSLNAARLPYAFAVYVMGANEVFFALPYGGSQTKMNHLMVYQEYEQDDQEKYRWYGPWSGGTAYERNCGALIAGKLHLGGFDGILYDMETGTNDVSTAVSASFLTGAPAPDLEASETQYRWLFARTYYDGSGYFPVTVQQRNEDGTGTLEQFTAEGAGFVLGTSRLGYRLQGRSMSFADTSLVGYGSNMALKYSNAAAGQSFTIRRVHVHYRRVGLKRKFTGV